MHNTCVLFWRSLPYWAAHSARNGKDRQKLYVHNKCYVEYAADYWLEHVELSPTKYLPSLYLRCACSVDYLG